MTSSAPRDVAILQILEDGKFHSGESMGEALSVSRAAVCNAVKRLTAIGVDIDSVKGKGYRLQRPIELLIEEHIRRHLDDRFANNSITILPKTASTNLYVAEHADSLTDLSVVFAEMQTGGKGRRGKQWISPFGRNLYLSLLVQNDSGMRNLAGLPLAVAVMVQTALTRLGVEGVSVKWPNDILLGGKKLAGILVEVSGEAEGLCHAIVGVGINMYMSETEGRAIDQAWTSFNQAGVNISRNRAAALVLQELLEGMERFRQGALTEFLGEWREKDCLYHQHVNVIQADGMLSGIAQGIDENGHLLVKIDNEIRRFHSGEVSLRRREG